MFELNEDQQSLVAMVRDFANEALAPNAAKWDETKHFPVDVLREAGALGMGGIYVQEEFGGSGLTRSDAVLIFEELAKADPTVQAIQLTKQLPVGGVFPSDYKTSSALHASLGVQREIARDFVLSADLAYRHFVHLAMGGPLDVNHFDSIQGPVIQECTAIQENDPQAICSRGPINVQEWQGRATYKGLLLRADKRFSHGFLLE